MFKAQIIEESNLLYNYLVFQMLQYQFAKINQQFLEEWDHTAMCRNFQIRLKS